MQPNDIKNQFRKSFWYSRDTVWDNTIEFTFSTYIIPPTLDLFNSNVLTLFNTGPIAPGIPNSYSISTGSSASYNQFIQDIQQNPKLIRRIILAPQDNFSYYLNQPLLLQYRDADGIQCTMPKITNDYYSKGQFQNVINIDFEPGELILDNQTIISQYAFAANSVVKMVLLYKEINLKDMLSHCGMSLCLEACSEKEKMPTYTEEALDLINTLKLIPTTKEEILKKRI